MILTTRETTSQIYQDALAIRQEVFVEGQGVPLAIEIDDKEDKCIHFVLYENDIALATCRLYPLDEATVLLQRMAVKPSQQGLGLGRTIMLEAMATAKAIGYHQMTLHSQEHASDFYQKLGFKTVGESYQEAGIDHINMTKRL